MGALCSSLPISDSEQEIATGHFEQLGLDQFGNQKAIKKVALAVIRYVVDKRRCEHGAEYDDLLREDEKYEKVKSSVLVTERGFMKLCSKVKDAVEEQTFRPETGFGLNPGRDSHLPDIDN